MIKKTKKGFTLVELLVVIAILAILASVSVVGYLSFTKKAQESNDISFVKQLNTILLGEEQLNGKPKTLHDALNGIEDNGFVVEKLTPTKENNFFLWDEDSNKFVVADETGNIKYPENINQENVHKLWKIVDKYESGTKYSQYLKDANYQNNEKILVTTGLDVGRNKENLSIEYNSDVTSKRNITFRTNSGELIVNGYVNSSNSEDGDSVNHYGYAETVLVKKIASKSYHEYGNVIVFKAKQGRIVLERGGNVGTAYNVEGASELSWVGIETPEVEVSEAVCQEHTFGQVDVMDVLEKNEIVRVKYHSCTKCGYVEILEDAVSIRVTPETAQQVLDGYNPLTNEYISLSGKTIHFTKGEYGDLVIRPTAKSFKDTIYKESIGGNPAKDVVVNETVGVDNFSAHATRSYYRTIESLVLEGETGVIFNSFNTVQGHLYGTETNVITDPVTGYQINSTNNSSYSYLDIKLFSVRNIEVNNSFIFGAYYNEKLVLEDTSFYNCKFNGKNGHGLKFIGNYKYCGNLIIDGCTFSTDAKEATGFYMTNATANLKITNSVFDGCQYNGIQIGTDKVTSGNMNIVIENNEFINCYSRPIKLHGKYTEIGSALIENNEITSAKDGKSFIQNTSVDNITFVIGANKYYSGQFIDDKNLIIVDDVTNNNKFEGCTNK